jgi:hypothetical protein
MLREREENRKEKKEFQRVVGEKGKEGGNINQLRGCYKQGRKEPYLRLAWVLQATASCS